MKVDPRSLPERAGPRDFARVPLQNDVHRLLLLHHRGNFLACGLGPENGRKF